MAIIFNFTASVKSVGAIILIVLLSLQSFSKIWIYISFKISQRYIAKTLCIKRTIANNTCQGKCHLRKQLEKEDQDEQKQMPGSKEKPEVPFCKTKSLTTSFIAAEFLEKRSFHQFKTPLYFTSFISGIFHPPKLNLI